MESTIEQHLKRVGAFGIKVGSGGDARLPFHMLAIDPSDPDSISVVLAAIYPKTLIAAFARLAANSK